MARVRPTSQATPGARPSRKPRWARSATSGRLPTRFERAWAGGSLWARREAAHGLPLASPLRPTTAFHHAQIRRRDVVVVRALHDEEARFDAVDVMDGRALAAALGRHGGAAAHHLLAVA